MLNTRVGNSTLGVYHREFFTEFVKKEKKLVLVLSRYMQKFDFSQEQISGLREIAQRHNKEKSEEIQHNLWRTVKVTKSSRIFSDYCQNFISCKIKTLCMVHVCRLTKYV